MSTEPIVTDASGEQDEVLAVNPRDAAMDAIASKVGREELPVDEGLGIEDGDHGDDTSLSVQDEQDTVTVKVDGQKITVPRDQIFEAGVRTYQKESAADKRLRQAAERERELLEKEENLKRMESELLERRNQQEDVEIDEESKAFADAIFTDEEKVAEHFAKINKKVRSVEEQLSQSKKEKAAEVEKELRVGTKHYHEKYPDISNDPDMHQALNRRLKTISSENPDLSITQVIDEAAGQVYERFGVKKDPPPEPPPVPPSKKEIKSGMAKQPKTASARKAPPPAEKPQTRSEALQEMRSNRGVQPY